MTPEWLHIAGILAGALRHYQALSESEWINLPAGCLATPHRAAAVAATEHYVQDWPAAVREAAKRVGLFLALDAQAVRDGLPHDHDPRGFWEPADEAALHALDREIKTASGERPLFDMEAAC